MQQEVLGVSVKVGELYNPIAAHNKWDNGSARLISADKRPHCGQRLALRRRSRSEHIAVNMVNTPGL